MNHERLEELWSKFLANTSLSASEEEELLVALRSDEQLREEFLKEAQVHAWLSVRASNLSDPEAPARRFLKRLGAERDVTGFIKKVESRLPQPSAGHPGVDHSPFEGTKPPMTQRSSPSTRRSTRRQVLERPSSWWVPAVLAAGLLIVVMTFFALVPSESDPASAQKTKDVHARSIRELELRLQSERERLERERDQALAEADAKRLQVEARLREIEEKRRILSQAKAQPSDPAGENEKREKALADLKRDQERIERDLRAAVDLAKKAEKPAAVGPAQDEKPADPQATPAPKQEASTQAAVAQIEEVSGEAFRLRPEGKVPLAPGAGVLAADGLETGGGPSRLVLRFPDKTRMELGPETSASDFKTEKGKGLILKKGTLRAVVAKQPKGEPMIVLTPHGQVKVVGTTLRLLVDPDPKKGTRLDVEEGKVELKDLAGKTVLVESGHFAVAATGVELLARSREGTLGRYLQGLPPGTRKSRGDGDWTVETGAVVQRKVSTIRGDEPKKVGDPESYLVFPYSEPKSFSLSVRVHLDEVIAEQAPGYGAWGFGLVVDFPGSEASFRTLQNNVISPTVPTALLDLRQGVLPVRPNSPDPPSVKFIPFQHERSGVYGMKLAVERRSPRSIQMRGKLWQGQVEPEAWGIQSELGVDGPVVQIGFMTCRCACHFTDLDLQLGP